MTPRDRVDDRIDGIVRKTINTNATGRFESAFRSVVQDVEPISKEIGVPPLAILRRLREHYGYDTVELRRAERRAMRR